MSRSTIAKALVEKLAHRPEVAGLLHDVGKCGVDREILVKE